MFYFFMLLLVISYVQWMVKYYAPDCCWDRMDFKGRLSFLLVAGPGFFIWVFWYIPETFTKALINFRKEETRRDERDWLNSR